MYRDQWLLLMEEFSFWGLTLSDGFLLGPFCSLAVLLYFLSCSVWLSYISHFWMFNFVCHPSFHLFYGSRPSWFKLLFCKLTSMELWVVSCIYTCNYNLLISSLFFLYRILLGWSVFLNLMFICCFDLHSIRFFAVLWIYF